MTTAADLLALRDRWSPAKAHERGSAQAYLIELCEALGVERPRPPGSGYEFELTIDAITTEGRESKNFIDLWKQDHFALEAKDHDPKRSNDLLLRRAFGQVRNYVAHTPGDPPPYILVLDVARTLVVWDRWSGSYGGYAAGRRIDLPTLHERPEDVALLRDVWEHPRARDPRARAQAVTKDIAGRLARLAASLESRGFEQERVARFLMRTVFSCFAEDIGLLPQEAFRQTVTEAGLKGSPEQFQAAVTALWRAMDAGGLYGFLRLLQFNGAFFRDAEALPLTRDDLLLLQAAAEADWAHVEPSIFGTLLVRALDPAERHRLGAEYTPRAFIERLVRPTVEEPLRERWTAVQAEVLQLRESGKKRDREAALERLQEFHAWMRGLRFLDPAAGSGNFLYVTMHMVKRLELEVLREIEMTKGQSELRFEEVGPWQFFGIEKAAWAREIAELVLWIGHHQFWREHHSVQPSEPILRDTGTLEHRDAVLVSDGEVRQPDRDRADPTPRLRHQVSGELVPDPSAKLEYRALVNPRPAEWPEADFLIGNPPFLGQFRQRDALGDGYVEALRAAYPEVPDAADLVMYWVHHAVRAVASGRTQRAGLIATQSITQKQNRKVLEDAAAVGVRPTWAIADHYWNDGSDDARVRVAMLVLAKEPPSGTLVTVDGDANVVATVRVPRLNSDLSAHADVPSAASVALTANAGLSSAGYKLHGAGFVVSPSEAERLLAADPALSAVLRPYRNGKDFTTRPRGVYLIDFGLMPEEEARRYPVLYDIVRERVMPERAANKRAIYAQFWWRFGEARRDLRAAMAGLPRFIVTPETAKHRLFEFLPANVAPDNSLIAIAAADAFVLGVLSSSIHAVWALAAGSRLGIDGTPRYNKGPCFDAFPFPDPPPALRLRIGEVAEQIDRHRKAALARSTSLGMTTVYNVLDRLRAGDTLTAAEREVHTLAACGTLRDLHDDLDALVAQAYGWSWPEPPALILERLVALHDERVEEEQAGKIRWLRPDFQCPRFAPSAAAESPALAMETAEVAPDAAPAAVAVWPTDAVGQITVLRDLARAGPVSAAEAVRRLRGARPDLVARHLETLAILGEVQDIGEGRYTGAVTAV